MQIRKTAGAIDGSLQCSRRRLLAISASKQVESFYRAVQRATKVTRNFPKSHFVVQIYQTDARWGGSRNAIEEMTGEKRCLTVKMSYPSSGEHIYVALCFSNPDISN